MVDCRSSRLRWVKRCWVCIDWVSDTGVILLGRLTEDGLGVAWQRHTVLPTTRLAIDEGRGWRVHVASTAAARIAEDVAAWAGMETGGILIGRLSEAAR